MKSQDVILEKALERAITTQVGQLFEVLVTSWDDPKAGSRFDDGLARVLEAADYAAKSIARTEGTS